MHQAILHWSYRMLEEKILAILACPICKHSIIQITQGKERALYCESCSLYYPIYKGIPLLLKKEALTQAQWEALHNTPL